MVLDDPEHLRELLSHADVWFDIGGSGLDPRPVHQELPDLITVSLRPFGRPGPIAISPRPTRCSTPSRDSWSCAGSPGESPSSRPGQPAFEVASAMAAYLALVALWNRAVNGVGDHIELSMHEA